MHKRFKTWWYHEKTYPNGSTFTRGQGVIYTCISLVALVVLAAIWLRAVGYLFSVFFG